MIIFTKFHENRTKFCGLAINGQFLIMSGFVVTQILYVLSFKEDIPTF